MDNTQQTNGKSTMIHLPAFSGPAANASEAKVPSTLNRVLNLVHEAVDLEFKLKATMAELDKETSSIGQGDLPSMLITMLKNHQGQKNAGVLPAPVVQPRPGPTKARARYKGKGGASTKTLRERVLDLLSDKKERTTAQIIKTCSPKNPSSIYTVLSDLIKRGELVRPRAAHYKLKG